MRHAYKVGNCRAGMQNNRPYSMYNSAPRTVCAESEQKNPVYMSGAGFMPRLSLAHQDETTSTHIDEFVTPRCSLLCGTVSSLERVDQAEPASISQCHVEPMLRADIDYVKGWTCTSVKTSDSQDTPVRIPFCSQV
jgi:hypothetical protein